MHGRLFITTTLKRLAFLAVCCLMLAACQSDTQPTNTPVPQSESIDAGLDEPFTLSVGESVTLADTALTLTFEMVERDGRCPSAVDCAESGPVVVIISAVQGTEQPTTFTMNPDPQLAQLSGMPPNKMMYQGYEIELTAVNPYPEQPEDLLNLPYTVTLIVRNP
jgi:hypothetical protein